jgi:hypothetical protein
MIPPSTNPSFDSQDFGASAPPYIILEGDTMEALEAEVETFLSEGWMLQGGVAVDQGKFYQAMVEE